MELGHLESAVPYLPFFIVIGWGLFRMFSKMGRRLYYRRKKNALLKTSDKPHSKPRD